MFRDYYVSVNVSVNDIMDHYHINYIIVNYMNYTQCLIEQEDLDYSGVTRLIDRPCLLFHFLYSF